MSNPLGPHGLQPTRLLCPWGFSKQEYWSGLPPTPTPGCPPPGDLPHRGTEPVSLTSPTLAGGFFIINATREGVKGALSERQISRSTTLTTSDSNPKRFLLKNSHRLWKLLLEGCYCGPFFFPEGWTSGCALGLVQSGW